MKDSGSVLETSFKCGATKRGWLKTAIILGLITLSVFCRLLFYGPLMAYGENYKDSVTGLPYFLDMDCYYHERMTKDIALYGHPGEIMKEGEPWDSLSYAPPGEPLPTTNHFWRRLP